MKNWTRGVRLKFVFLIAVPCVVLAIVFAISLSTFRELNSSIVGFVDQDIPSALSLGALNAGLMTMSVDLYEAAGEPDAKLRAKALADAKEEYKDFLKEIDEFKKYEMSAEEKTLFGEFETSWAKQRTLLDSIITNIEKGDVRLAETQLRGPFGEGLHPLDEIFTKFDAVQTASLAQTKAESEQLLKMRLAILFVISTAGLIAICVISLFTAMGLVKTLSATVSALTGSSLQVNSAATQIASSADGLSSASVEQSAALQETMAAIEEIRSMISKSSDAALESSKLTKTSFENAERGKITVDEMVRAMNGIDSSNKMIVEQVGNSTEQMGELAKVIHEIGEKTKIINDIVFQTKLLSFNASVEAARAGENGKGFAVVAEEVGNLARMSGTAAEEISSLLNTSIQKVNTTVESTKSSVKTLVEAAQEKVRSGVKIAEGCGEVLDVIVRQASEVRNRIEEISAASAEQSTGVNEIAKAMTQLDQMTQRNTVASQESAGSANVLNNEAKNLQLHVNVLVETMDGRLEDDSQAQGYNRQAA